MTDYGFKFGQVWCQQRGATVTFKIGAFRVDQYRNLRSARQRDHALHLAQRALGVIRQHQCANLR
ncbi:hypothetical protein D3C80_2024950 [compost metagenome]